MTPSIESALVALGLAGKKYRQVVKRQQICCKHPQSELIECEYLAFSGGGSLAPMRVCLKCGMSEQGWGCGYLVLRGNARVVLRDDLYSFRHGLMVTEDDKGPLLRGETTVAELVEMRVK